MNSTSDWRAATWEGSRRAQIMRSLRLTVRERLEALEALSETSERLLQSAILPPEAATSGAGLRHESDPVEPDGAHVILLEGCSPTPLASYLKALGILRLVAEQADPEARGYWAGETFALSTALSEDGLGDFFGNHYEPTPILAPWNGGSGFYPADNKDGFDPLRASPAYRFHGLRAAIGQVQEILESESLRSKPDGEAKSRLLTRLRAEVDDSLLGWLDSAVLLSGDNPKYPPLLGTGGNDGRLDFTNNFMQHLVAVIDPATGESRPDGRAHLRSALLGVPSPGMVTKAIGQFMPGAAGGPNAGSAFQAAALINPWDFILMLEGAVLFAAAATKRHTQLGEGRLSYPFTVRPTGSGSGRTAIADESPARGEIWMPLWEHSLGLPELRTLLGEGRATLGRHAARDGLDFVRAVSKLGVERGITAFQRYSFMRRSGKAYLATPLNRVPVRRNPQADLIDQLDHNRFLDRFRRFSRSEKGSNHAQRLVYGLEHSLFEVARNAGSKHPRRIQTVIEAMGEIVLYLADSPVARVECPRLPRLDGEWLLAADDQTPEFRLAAALAGLGVDGVPMLCHLLPASPSDPTRYDEQSRLVTWHHGHLTENLVAVVRRRLIEAARRDDPPSKPFSGRPAADLAAIAAFLAHETDDARIARLLCGLALVGGRPRHLPSSESEPPLPAAYRVMKPLFVADAQLRRIGFLDEYETLPLPGRLPGLLAADRTQDAVDVALGRLRASGLPAAFRLLNVGHGGGPRLLAALAVPIDDRALSRLVRRIRLNTRPKE